MGSLQYSTSLHLGAGIEKGIRRGHGAYSELCQDLLKARDLDDSIAADVEKELAKLKRQQKAP